MGGSGEDITVKPRAALSRRSRRTTLLIAMAADALQLVLLPFFVGGLSMPWDAALDVIVAAVMVRRLGWHPALLPTFVAELVPGLDLVPSWTAAVWFVMRSKPAGETSPEA